MIGVSSSSNSPSWLVIGAEGIVGRALYARLTSECESVVAAVRRPGRGPAGSQTLDLGDLKDWKPSEDVVVVAAARSRLQDCEDDSEAAERINVEAPVAIAKACAAAGAFPIFYSTNRVFDGLDPAPRRDQPIVGDRTVYGRSKAAMEKALLALATPLAILRLTKVATVDNPLFAGWREALAQGRTVDAFHDMPLAPVPIDLVVEGTRRIGRGRLSGLWHFSSADEISYLDAARIIARYVGAKPDLVRGVATANSNVPSHFAPRYSRLDVTETAQALALQFPTAEQVVHAWLGDRASVHP